MNAHMFVRITKLSISLLFWLCESLRRIAYRALNIYEPAACTVLYYHNVANSEKEKFKRQMRLLAQLTQPVAVNTPETLRDGSCYTALTFDDGFQGLQRNAIPVLIRKKIPFTLFVPTGFIGKRATWMNGHSSKADEIFSESQLREISKSEFVSIGSHSVNHRKFSSLSDRQAEEELVHSKKHLEKLLKTRVETFSFPHGSYHMKHIDLARRAGYRHVFTITPELTRFRADEVKVGRIITDPKDWLIEFRLKFMGAYRWMAEASKIKRTMCRALLPERHSRRCIS